jgi:uncharacterized membrane protein YpjA
MNDRMAWADAYALVLVLSLGLWAVLLSLLPAWSAIGW